MSVVKEGVVMKLFIKKWLFVESWSKVYKKEKASTTLEAIIIMPTILIMIFAVFFAFQIMYQYVVLEYAVSYGASRGTMTWQYEGGDVSHGKRGPYDSIAVTVFGSSTQERESKIETEVENIINSLTMVSAKNIAVNAEYKNSLVDAKIVVTASQDIVVPFEGLLQYVNGNDGGDMKIEARSVGSIFDPDEYIRNIDYAKEIGSQISKKTGISDGISKIKNYVEGLIK